jgi:tRNA(Ile)-lysidine synthase
VTSELPVYLDTAIATVPPGKWAIAVSGGADSVCLLRLAATRADLQLHVLHLDHEARGEASAADARFVADLAESLKIPSTLSTASRVEAALAAEHRPPLPANRSARFRALRLELYCRAIAEHELQGVLLAHHADDQAETVLLRLIRGGGFASLAGMAARTIVSGVTLLRPLLDIRRSALRDHLRQIGQPWREDASNASDTQARNRVRKVLASRPELTAGLCDVASNCRRLKDWAAANAILLRESFATRDLADLPEILASATAIAWLAQRGVPIDALSAEAVVPLIEMCCDAASPARWTAPGDVGIRRRAGRIYAGSMDPK